MNIRISIIILVVASLAGCNKEQIPSGLLLQDELNTTDTTYMTSNIPSPQTKKIFVEEATGVRCANCPSGADILRNLKLNYPDKIISASIYSPFLNYFQPPAQYDFNNSDDSALVFFLNSSDPNKPQATIDRLETGGTPKYFFDKTLWNATIAGIISKTTPLNIDLSATPTGNTDEFLITSKITFTDTITADLGISIYLIEDHVIDYQDSMANEVLNYEHNHILRKIITPISGSSFLGTTTTKEKGRVFEKFTTFTLPAMAIIGTSPRGIVNKSNLKLICFVHKTGLSKEVIHVEEIDL